MELVYTSKLPLRHRAELESLLFFNRGQDRVRDEIIASVAEYGSPSIVATVDRLAVRLQSGNEVQTLFALAGPATAPRLAGVMIYTRITTATLLVLHLAVAHEFAADGRHAGTLVLLRFIARLREIAGSVRGIRFVEFMYGPTERRSIAVAPEMALV